METAFANVSHISRLNTIEVREWGRLPSDRVHSGGIRKGKRSNEPQGMSTIELRHLPKTCQRRGWTETLLEVTCCIYPNMIAGGA